MNIFNYMDAEFAAPGIFIITRKNDWVKDLEYSERQRHEWKHIKIEPELAGKEVLNDICKKKKKQKKQTYIQWLLQEKLTKRRAIG